MYREHRRKSAKIKRILVRSRDYAILFDANNVPKTDWLAASVTVKP
jgi:hypothetical protein